MSDYGRPRIVSYGVFLAALDKIDECRRQREALQSSLAAANERIAKLESERDALNAGLEHNAKLSLEACGKLARVEKAAEHFAGCVMTVKKKNTAEWMHFIGHEINDFARAIGSESRVELRHQAGDMWIALTPKE